MSKTKRGLSSARSLHFSFVVSKLVSGGCEFGCNFKLTRFANCLFGVVILCVKHSRAGWYLLLKSDNKIVLVYHSNVITAGCTVLFSPYKAHAPKCSESFSNRTVYNLRCNGFLVTPYDLGVGAVYNRALVCDTACAPEFNDMFAIELNITDSKLARTSVMFSNIKLRQACDLRTLANVKQLNRDLVCVNSSWSVYRDSFCLLRWFANTKNTAGGNVYDYFLFISSVYGVFIHINYADARLRSCVANERLLLLSGYIRLANKLALSSDERLFSIIGVLDIDWLREENAAYNALLVISSDPQFSISSIRAILGLFVLDSSMSRYSKFRTLNLGIKYLFLNSAAVVVNNRFCCGVSCCSAKLLQLNAVVATNVGAITFLKLPVWRLDLTSSADSPQCWHASLGNKWFLDKLKRSRKLRVLSVTKEEEEGKKKREIKFKKTYFNVLMSLRRYFNSFEFREFKTDCLLHGTQARLFAALSFVSLHAKNLFIRCSAVPNLAAQYSGCSSTVCGVYETGKLTVNCKTFEFFCVIGDSQVFSHLFCSVYNTFFRILPLIVRSSGDDWQVLDLSLNVVCACGKLPCLALRFYGFVKNVFYFECRSDCCNRLPQTLAVYVFNSIYFVAEVGIAFGLHNFARKLQRYNSMLCSVRLQSSSCFASFSLVILSLKSFVLSFGVLNNLRLALENLIQSNDSKLVWRC
ncbi:Phenylalanine--tRNA ligase beta subunit [Candidatus Hodgkinia cicadicola]|nr:Phenylalanine--tRNA ligase beta subunit [Candidatus Hodgkinia cicadicola]